MTTSDRTSPGAGQSDEFGLIAEYFDIGRRRDDVLLAVGDDAAILQPPEGMAQVMTMDTLLAGVHFPADTPPADIACKCIAVNLSDLAAMGAEPAWLLLSISLPEVDHAWLQAFSTSFNASCREHHVDLVGGDTVRGPLAITVQATGFIEPGWALRRDGARAGDRIYITGTLGDAALALQLDGSDEQIDACLQRLRRPEPRSGFGRALAAHSKCAIDISDGLLADLGHVLEASGCGARLDLGSIPLSAEFETWFERHDAAAALQLALGGGDDYELCFTAAPAAGAAVAALAAQHDLRLSCVGEIRDEPGLELAGATDEVLAAIAAQSPGYRHFT